jgi:hypothetical protein
VVLRFGFPERPGCADLGDRLARPQPRGVDVSDRLLGDASLPVAGVEQVDKILRSPEAPAGQYGTLGRCCRHVSEIPVWAFRATVRTPKLRGRLLRRSGVSATVIRDMTT